MIPPFQSPDEFAHVKRAYLLSKGEVFLRARDGTTGGDIDTGLLAYMNVFERFPFQYDKKLTDAENRSSKRIVWSEKRQFSGLSNTAVYFPVLYLPQAMAITFGERIGLSVRHTYYFARVLSLAATLGLLWAALLTYPTPLIVIALFAIPMTMFQLGCASLDAITFGMCALTAALFKRGSDVGYSFDARMHLTLFICVLFLATARINLIALTLLPAVLYPMRGSRSYLISSATSLGLSFAWIVFALITVKGMPSRELSTIEVANYYLTHPGSLLRIFLNTLGDAEILKSYWAMFIGVLGWLDTPLDSYVYVLFGLLLFILSVVSLRYDKISLFNAGSLSLSCAALVSLAFLFLIELLTWTSYPAKVIDGIQGRYFTPILILLGYSMFGRSMSPLALRWGWPLIPIAIAFSIMSMTPKLLDRYWLG